MVPLKIIENGRVIGEFKTLQEAFDFNTERTKRLCYGEIILSQKQRDFNLKLKWFTIGVCVGIFLSFLIILI